MADYNTDANPAPSVANFGLTLFFMWIFLFVGLLQQNMGFVSLSAAILLLAYGSRLWSRLALLRLDVDLRLDKNRLFPDDEFCLTASLKNNKLLPLRLRLLLPEPSGSLQHLPFDDPAALLAVETSLLSYEVSTKTWTMTAPRRGLYILGPAQVYAGDPTGLSEKSKRFSGNGELIVFPRLRGIGEIKTSFQEYFGIHASKGPVEDPAWYAGTRDYTGNRPARNIHWKASARLGKLQEKLYEPTSHRKVLFVFEVKGYLESETELRRRAFETALEALGSLSAMLMETGASFGLVTNARINGGSHRYLHLGRGPEHLGALLEILARLERKPGGNLEELVYQVGKGGTGFIYMGHSPDNRSSLFFGLPAAQRKKIFFLFSRGSQEDSESEADTKLDPRKTTESPVPLPVQLSEYPAGLVEDIFDES